MITKKIAIAEINIGNNPRVELQPSDPEYVALKASIGRFGMVQPLVWNKQTGNLVGGHQRFNMLKEAGEKKVDVVVVDLPQAEEIALNVALNKIQGKWDDRKLLESLTSLLDTPIADGSGNLLLVTGFGRDEFEALSKALLEDTTELFEPVMPDAEAAKKIEAITSGDIKQAETKQATRFAAAAVRDVTCPHCGQSFGLGGAAKPGEV